MMLKLTKAEEEIMQAIWSLEQATVGDVIGWIKTNSNGKEQPANSTISTMLRIMEDKGFLSHSTVGRVFLYSALIDKAQYATQSLQMLVTDYFEGSSRHLISALVQQEKLSQHEIADLQALLHQATMKKSGK
jgi:BlaI family transcriptional regulator, penicillinase repressor